MQIELIEKLELFHQGELSRSALEAFADAENISELDEKIEWFQNTQLAIESSALREQLKNALPKPEMKSTLTSSSNQTLTANTSVEKKETGGKVRSLNATRWISSLAACLLVLMAGWWIFQGPSANLYDQYKFVDPGLPVVMSESKNYELYDALSYYGEENYETAINKLSELQNQQNTDTVAYYLGASYLYQGDFNKAKTELSKVATHKTSSFEEKSAWLMILCEVQLENQPAAKESLQKIIAQPQHEFKDQAIQLLESLKP